MNIEAIKTFLKDQTAASLASDIMRLYATTRALEIISEATRRLPEDMTARHPNIDWRAVRDAGNLYRHSYSRVVASRIWHTANELNDLETMVAMELSVVDPSDAPDGAYP